MAAPAPINIVFMMHKFKYNYHFGRKLYLHVLPSFSIEPPLRTCPKRANFGKKLKEKEKGRQTRFWDKTLPQPPPPFFLLFSFRNVCAQHPLNYTNRRIQPKGG